MSRPDTEDKAVRDRARLERLVRDHYAFVWRCARRLGVRPSDLEDVVQEVFVVATRNVDSIVSERGYLFRSCVFAAAHVRRSILRRREVADDETIGAIADPRTPERNAETAEARERLQKILDEMSEEYRSVFVLFELERLTFTEIATMLDLPRGTVASRVRRSREFFVARMKQDEGEGT